MLQIPRLDEMMRVTDNSNKLAAAGFSFNEIQDLKKQEVLNSMNAPRPLGGSFGGAGLAGGFDTQPRRYAEGGTIEMARPGMGIARSQFLKQPTGVVPPGIAAANPGAYWSPKLQSVVIGDPKRNTEKAVGGTTWSGPAIKDGQFFANTGATSFEMPKPGERRGPIGGRATPPAPDMFGRQFGSAPDTSHLDADGYTTARPADTSHLDADGYTTARPADTSNIGPDGYTRSGGKRNYADGGTIVGLGGPKDDMIPAMVDGIKPIAVSNGEEIVDAETRDYFGRKFFIDLKKKAEKGMEEAKGHTEEGHGEKTGFAEGGTAFNTSLMERAMADQDLAAAANYISPQAVIPTQGGGIFNRAGGANTGWESEGMRHYLFPQEGITRSLAAQSSLKAAIEDVGKFFDQQPQFDAAIDRRRQRSREMIQQLEDPAYKAELKQNVRRRYNLAPNLSSEPYGPTMNDHPAFQSVPAAPPIAPAPSAMITPALEPQPMTAQFAPRTLGEPAAPPRPSNVPFLAPWEKDAARAAAADAASGRPAGVRKSDWRKFQRSPQGMMLAMQRTDAADQQAREDRRIEDDRKVRWNERMAEFNQNLAARQIQQQAEDQQWKDRLAVTENFRMAGENQRLASDAALNAATEARKKQALSEWTPIPNSNLQINGLGHVVGREGKAFSMEEAQKLGLELDSIDSEGRARWKRPDAGSPMMKDLYDGSISGVPTTLQFNPRTGQWERPVIAAGAGLKPGGETPVVEAPAVAPAPAAGEFKVTARTTKEEVAALPAGTRVVMPDGTVKFKK